MGITAIMIDSREPEWVQKLEFGGLPKTVTMLDWGDCMAATDDGSMVLVERKTPDDFLGSLRDERLFLQLSNMLLITRYGYLMITGELQRGPGGVVVTDRGQTGWSWAAVQGALLTIQEMGIFVTYSGGDQDYEAAILRLGNRDRKAVLELGPAKKVRLLDPSEAIVSTLPGIGIERLHQVMEYCQTAANALVALTDEDTQIPAVPMSVKKRVRQALGLTPGQEFQIHINEQGHEVLKVMSVPVQ
jgi:ERCC4-type nuclease